MVERTLGQLRTVDAMPDATPELTIGQVAEQTGLSVHTLRFYEREGLLPMQIRRSSTGRRVYSAPDIEWLRICTSLRASGMPLDTIRRYVGLVRQGVGNETVRLGLLRAHREYVAVKIDELRACLNLITYKIDVYERHLAQGTADGLWNPPPTDGSS